MANSRKQTSTRIIRDRSGWRLTKCTKEKEKIKRATKEKEKDLDKGKGQGKMAEAEDLEKTVEKAKKGRGKGRGKNSSKGIRQMERAAATESLKETERSQLAVSVESPDTLQQIVGRSGKGKSGKGKVRQVQFGEWSEDETWNQNSWTWEKDERSEGQASASSGKEESHE